ncbi:MAG: transporter substrate-binding domain-containing protein [Planctomycetia bacterium]
MRSLPRPVPACPPAPGSAAPPRPRSQRLAQRLSPRLALLLGAVLALLPAGCGRGAPAGTLERIRERGALVIATEAEFRPFEWVEPSGKVVGFDIDLAEAVAEGLGVRLEVRNVKFDSILSELRQGLADLVVSGMTVTPERAQSVRFSQPYFFTVTALLLNRASAGTVAAAGELDDPARTVAVKEGTTGEQSARKMLPRARIVSHKTENGAALDVAEGRADAFLYDLHSVEQHHAQHPERTVLLRTPVTVEAYAIAGRLEDSELMARVDATLEAMRKDGRLAALKARHGPTGSIEAPR